MQQSHQYPQTLSTLSKKQIVLQLLTPLQKERSKTVYPIHEPQARTLAKHKTTIIAGKRLL